MGYINYKMKNKEKQTVNQKQRQEYISEMLKVRGSVTTNELVEEFGVSKMTIGRDLKELETSGIAELFHGGAMYVGASILEYPIMIKQDLYVKEKQQIAKLVANDIPDGCSVFLETGTTILYVALELINKKKCTFYTNSLSVANHFAKIDELNIHMIPGKYRSMSDGFVGIETVDYLSDKYFDYCIVGTEGISEDGAMSVHTEEDALTKKAVMTHSKNSILVFDRSKVGKKLLHKFSEVEKLDKIVTDYEDIADFLHEKSSSKLQILIAKE